MPLEPTICGLVPQLVAQVASGHGIEGFPSRFHSGTLFMEESQPLPSGLPSQNATRQDASEDAAHEPRPGLR